MRILAPSIPRLRPRLQGALVALSLVALAVPARAADGAVIGPFRASADDLARLGRGECVSYAAEEKILGKPRMVLLAYQRIRTSRARLAQAMVDPAAYLSVLPRTRSAQVTKVLGQSRWVALTQGNSFVELRYVMRVDPNDEGTFYRFGIDERYAHDLDDAWGFLRLEAMPSSRGLRDHEIGEYLVGYGLVFDLGGGLLQSMFSERILAVLRTIPDRLRRYVETAPAPTSP